MAGTNVEELIARGIRAANSGKTSLALECFEEAVERRNTPANWSYLAFCLAKERRQFDRAIQLCQEAIRKDPQNAVHYLNLGRVHLLAGRTKDAIHVFRQGLLYEANAHIEAELRKIGLRKPPVVGFLRRNHPINKYLGIMMKKLRLR
ncbi:tetratricopeptide repeat protein [Geobacter grbiciae]|uniref:tetratricopeptide repeat protein n=1 Tax=Geobacter grbiciae TaxID=155042 RepID=UPI001C02BE4D|nr:tetratricopeptide repeat protein [Geobacter grbiciae]